MRAHERSGGRSVTALSDRQRSSPTGAAARSRVHEVINPYPGMPPATNGPARRRAGMRRVGYSSLHANPPNKQTSCCGCGCGCGCGFCGCGFCGGQTGRHRRAAGGTAGLSCPVLHVHRPTGRTHGHERRRSRARWPEEEEEEEGGCWWRSQTGTPSATRLSLSLSPPPPSFGELPPRGASSSAARQAGGQAGGAGVGVALSSVLVLVVGLPAA
eukprot:scaffold719_cov359-Prasinococcus_capsulatus_cf.AAC.10